MKQMRLMLLGGLRYLLPIIEEAHKLGAYVITADNVPTNVAHKYSDEYCNVSIIDKEAVLAKAKELKIDGILSHAVDPGVVSAAFVAEQMGLPFQCSYEVACILQDKSRFRKFLLDNGFNCPTAKGYVCAEDAFNDIDLFHWPVIVKPVDSAGSKGVTKVEHPESLSHAIDVALRASINKQFIIEDFLEKDGHSVGSESFAVNGELRYNGFYDQIFDDCASNPFVPSAEIWPTDKPSVYINEMKSELQRMFDILHIRTGLFNIECRVCTDGKVYIMEVSPRGGGNRLSEMLKYATDVNINEAETRKALALPLFNMNEPSYNGYYAIQVLHSDVSGHFDHIEVAPLFYKQHIIEQELRINKGDMVMAFSGANNAIGTQFLRFETREELDYSLAHTDEWMKIHVQ